MSATSEQFVKDLREAYAARAAVRALNHDPDKLEEHVRALVRAARPFEGLRVRWETGPRPRDGWDDDLRLIDVVAGAGGSLTLGHLRAIAAALGAWARLEV